MKPDWLPGQIEAIEPYPGPEWQYLPRQLDQQEARSHEVGA